MEVDADKRRDEEKVAEEVVLHGGGAGTNAEPVRKREEITQRERWSTIAGLGRNDVVRMRLFGRGVVVCGGGWRGSGQRDLREFAACDLPIHRCMLSFVPVQAKF